MFLMFLMFPMLLILCILSLHQVRANVGQWKELFDGPSPQTAAFPNPWNDLLSFRKLLVLRALRPDKVTEAMQLFITAQLDAKFIEPPPFDLPLSFKPSTVRTPLIFVLSAGSDPMKDVLKFADTMKMAKRFHAISLGQGQGPRGTSLVLLGLVGWLVGWWWLLLLIKSPCFGVGVGWCW